MKKILKKIIGAVSLLIVFSAAGCEFLEDRGNINDPLSSNFIERAPVAGNEGLITADSVGSDSLVLKWTAAEDDTTNESEMEYAVYRSSSNNIITVADCETNGTPVQDYTSVFTTRIVTGLTPSTTYYFNVVTRDYSGNKVAYVMILQATTAVTDTQAPVPGNSGTITAGSITETSLTLSWSAASDNITGSPNLQYAVFMSDENNIGEVLTCEINGTLVQNYTANLTSQAVSGLTEGTTYYFNVIVKDEKNNKAVYAVKTQSTAADSTSPAPGGSGVITTGSIADTSLALSWTAASDNITAAADLQYTVYRSTADNISTPANCVSNGTPVQDYTANLTAKSVSGLTASTTYYFNVLVRDAAGNVNSYTRAVATTSSAPDTTAPTRGGSGVIDSNDDVLYNSLYLDWTMATDNVTEQDGLQYAVYRSTTNNITTVAGCESNGTLIKAYTANISFHTAINLTAGTTYYFNVIVKDAAGNKTCYVMKSQATLAPVVPTVTTANITRIGRTNAMGGGTVTSNGGVSLTARGICWTTTGFPTISDSKTSQGTSVSSFISNLYPLSLSTTYLVRAYATNSVGTAYGSTVTFKTILDYNLGDTGTGGGRIFYIKNTAGKLTYYEAMPSDGGADAKWSNSYKIISGADGEIVGTGKSNTDDIVADIGSGGPAAYGCYNLTYGGKSDWFLPSIEELNYMYTNLHLCGIGYFGAYSYWSSTEYNINNASTKNFLTGKTGYTFKIIPSGVRPVRSFIIYY